MTADPFADRLERQVQPRLSWRQIAEAVTLRPALRPWLMGTVVFWAFLLTTVTTIDDTPLDASEPTGVTVLLDSGPVLMTLALLIAIFFVTALSALVLQRSLNAALPRLGFHARIGFLLGAPILIAIIVEIFVQVFYVAPGLADQISENLLLRLLPAISILVLALLIVINRSLTEALINTEQRSKALTHELSWELSRIQSTYTREQNFFASQLHGPLQSVLISASMRIEQNEPGTPAWNDALQEVRSDFQTIMERLVTGPDTSIDLAESLDDLRRTWSDVCDIDIVIDDDVMSTLNRDWISAGIVNEILVDACANAAIHGSAQNVRIEIHWCADEEIMITVTNDGSTDDGGAPGMGSATLDRVAMTWSRDVVPEGLRLTVTLAVLTTARSSI